jgi:hypothetical protein
MKTMSRLVGFVMIALFMTSCCLMTARTNYQQTCNSNYFTKNQCGTVIVDRCKHVCETCSFSEPQCKVCWACVSCESTGGPCVYNDL